MVGDHNMGNDNEYCWWRTQQANDLYTVPGAFISMYGYERSVPYPNGHRNVIWAERGHKTLPLLPKVKTGLAGDYLPNCTPTLRATGGICTLHTSAAQPEGPIGPTRTIPRLEPFVRKSSRASTTVTKPPAAPKSISDKTELHPRQIRAAGLRLVSGSRRATRSSAFQASSDHISTHVSYACVLAEEFSRKGLVEAMKKRHTYAATDNIILDFPAVAARLMGDETRSAKPKFAVVVLGTGPIATVDLVRNSQVVHTARPAQEKPAELRFEWEDAAPPQGERANYYYVRVTQRDGQMAWSSPIWVTK